MAPFQFLFGNLSSSLEKIAAVGCGIKGTIPSEIGNLISLTYLSLFANDLIGAIPMTVKGMQKLQALDLSRNKIQGFIPQEILDLSHNNLSGMIPKSTIKLLNLIYFNVSFNSLSGEIQTSGPFQNFTSQSFISN
ncbi:LOW QUALITY PROTEIN: hypothetical protein RJ640_025986 [Escallonia rubra]|uniref:Non-specific serine/threonine protein kinase n=1 Tax=Escallonia rubra TaxID=112253 RepID=A0AA88QIX4_9ASTE|nr:LOW QUALITY PROTEIN: hypothetical protein RJ640_025986 [Escallonia rubra]